VVAGDGTSYGSTGLHKYIYEADTHKRISILGYQARKVSMKKDLKNEKRGGMYWKGTQAYPSVTQILSVIDKPTLRHWYGRQVFYAMLANPNLSEKQAMSAPYEISSKAKDRGSTVHSIVEAFENGNKVKLTSIPTEYRGYAKAFYRWVEQMKITILQHERTIFSEQHKYAGTLDLVVQMGEEKPPKLYVIDVKTGKDIYSEAFMQIAAYRAALAESKLNVQGVGVILLGKEGEYKFEAMEDTEVKFNGFLACKKIWEALNEEMLRKVAYFV